MMNVANKIMQGIEGKELYVLSIFSLIGMLNILMFRNSRYLGVFLIFSLMVISSVWHIGILKEKENRMQINNGIYLILAIILGIALYAYISFYTVVNINPNNIQELESYVILGIFSFSYLIFLSNLVLLGITYYKNIHGKKEFSVENVISDVFSFKTLIILIFSGIILITFPLIIFS